MDNQFRAVSATAKLTKVLQQLNTTLKCLTTSWATKTKTCPSNQGPWPINMLPKTPMGRKGVKLRTLKHRTVQTQLWSDLAQLFTLKSLSRMPMLQALASKPCHSLPEMDQTVAMASLTKQRLARLCRRAFESLRCKILKVLTLWARSTSLKSITLSNPIGTQMTVCKKQKSSTKQWKQRSSCGLRFLRVRDCRVWKATRNADWWKALNHTSQLWVTRSGLSPILRAMEI